MMRTFLLWLSEQQGVFNFLRRNSLARKFASRFVAGETRGTATAAALELKNLGIMTTLDLLGESVNQPADATAARDEYLRMLDGLAASGAEINVSVKLTQMGFDIDEALCLDNMRRILAKARDLGGFVRLDMESSEYTQLTLDFFERHLLADFGKHTGVVIQSCLRRSTADVKRLIDIGARVRLCKGAYLEAPDVAFPDKAEVDTAYVQLMERLMEHGNYPAIATHDAAIIARARDFAARKKIDSARLEFQMLYGVRRDLQDSLCRAGYKVRVYVPFGNQWYPYLMRRLAERPANIAFILANLLREGVHRRS